MRHSLAMKCISRNTGKATTTLVVSCPTTTRMCCQDTAAATCVTRNTRQDGARILYDRAIAQPEGIAGLYRRPLHMYTTPRACSCTKLTSHDRTMPLAARQKATLAASVRADGIRRRHGGVDGERRAT